MARLRLLFGSEAENQCESIDNRQLTIGEVYTGRGVMVGKVEGCEKYEK